MTAMLTSREVQDLINVDRSTIYRMAEQGRIPAVKVGRQWRFPLDAVQRWLVERAPQAAPELAAMGHGGEATLAALLPGGAVQTATELFADILGVMLVVTEMDGRPVTEVANPCGLFSAVAANPESMRPCIEGWRDYSDAGSSTPAFRPSHFGFLCARSFIHVGGKPAGMLIIGGIAPEEWPPGPAQIDHIAASFHADRAVIGEHISEVHYADGDRRRWILDYLPRIAQVLARFANERSHLLGRLQAIAALAGAAPTPERSNS